MKRLIAILLVLVVGWLGVLFIGFMFLGGPEDMEPDLVRNENGEVIAFTRYPQTDADLEQLRDMPELETILLSGCENITDTGLVHLKGLTNLQYLNLMGTQITDSGVAELQKALHNCEINR